MKRIFDIAVAFLLLIAASPIFLLVALTVFLTSKGPIIYRQVRVGQNGMHFGLLKFRTMVFNADQIGDYRTQVDDPRITPCGRILRRLSLDELPQLVNVLRGEMSIVGPRPDTPMQEKRYTTTEWRKRLSIRPGITGLAQATMRSAATHNQRMALDFHYIDNQSLWLDLKILVMTLGKLTGENSN